MNYRSLLLAAIMLLLAAAPVFAQFDAEDDLGAGAEAPPAARARPADAANPADAATLADFAARDPVIGAVLDMPRDTPAQQLSAILALIDLGRTDVAALLVPELLAAEIDDAGRAALVGEFGTAPFMQLIRADSPAAEGAAAGDLAGLREFAQACIDAAAAANQDPGRIAGLIEQLNAPAEGDRYAARVDLRATGEAGIIAGMHALATATTPEARGHIMDALAQMRPAVDEPLIAVLAEGRGQVRADAATLAGRAKVRAALPWLTALAVSEGDRGAARAAEAALAGVGVLAPSPAEAQVVIEQQIAALEAMPLDRAGEEIVELRDAWWSWDPAANQLAAAEFSPRQHRTLARARLARALVEAGATVDPAARRLYVIDALEEAELLGREASADVAQQFAAMSPSELSTALADAVDRSRFIAAAQISALIAARNDATVLATPEGRPSPLADALKSPDRDLRFAALAAVMQLNPQHSFPGASFVPKALWYFAAGAGDPAAIAAAPEFTRASAWAGQLRGLGYEAMPAATGRAAIMGAVDPAVAPRLAVIVLDSDISFPVVREIVYQLHSADRTAGVPILIAASTEHYAAAQHIAAHDPLVLAEPRPQGEAALAEAVERTLALATPALADKPRRTEQASQALDWLAKLLAADAPYDELRRDGALVRRTLLVPELTEPSIRVLAALGTADSQIALADYASALSLPIEVRRAAADALAANIKRHGIQLTTDQILAQYDRYNASATADAETQAVLGRILDMLEKKK